MGIGADRIDDPGVTRDLGADHDGFQLSLE
jgi:hypothetical protein